MSLFVVGINHKTAPIALREKVFFSQELLGAYLQDLLGRGHAREAVLLSTCNRSELYCDADELAEVKNWFCSQSQMTPDEIAEAVYTYTDEAAVAHMMMVATGLDSMVLGEPQILGQIKEAFSESCAVNAIGTLFHRLFQQLFAFSKEIRTTTAIGACPVSVASASVHFAKQRYPDFDQAKIALIGAGDTSELLLRYFKTHSSQSIAIINRTIENAVTLADKWGVKAHDLDDMVAVLSQSDIVFSSTGSPVPLVTKALVEAVQALNPLHSLIFIDLAVPRDIEESVAELPNTEVYCIDDLKAIIAENRQGREHAAEKVKEMILQKSKAFMAEIKTHDKVSDTIRAYRHQIEAICRAELLKAKQQIEQGAEPSSILESFAHAFTKKLLHSPSIQLRQAAQEGRVELLHFAKQLFAISDS